MIRRRTSVIGPGRAEPFVRATAASSSQDVNATVRWSMAAARELTLGRAVGHEGDIDLARVQRCWDIARGRLEGNPEETAGRSEVRRIASPQGDSFWRKRFDQENVVWQLNEAGVLSNLGAIDKARKFNLREHVGWMRAMGADHASSALDYVETLDAGPNLSAWQEFTPCSEMNGFAIPLFAQAVFLAALVRSGLFGLEKLANGGVVHNDVKPTNMCMALPKNMQNGQHRTWLASVDLQQIKLRFIDFETGFAPNLKRLVNHNQADYISPFARACHAETGKPAGECDNQGTLDAIDWGCDLWSLGYWLDQWIRDAQAFWDGWMDAVHATFGHQSAVYLRADEVCGAQCDALKPLQVLVAQLQDQDRPLIDVGKIHLPPREPNHAALRAQLERNFPLLTSERSTLAVKWIDPHAPLAFAPGMGRWNAFKGSIQKAKTDLLGELRQHQKIWGSGVVAIAAASALWANAAEIKAWSQLQVEGASYHLANGWRSHGLSVQRLLLKQATGWPLPLAREGILRSVAEEPAWSEMATPSTPPSVMAEEMLLRRLRSLRALAQWNDAGGDITSPDSRAAVERLLHTLYLSQNRIQALNAGREASAETYSALQAAQPLLDALTGQAGHWPLAELMSLRLHACYNHAPDLKRLGAHVQALAGVANSTPSAAIYQAYAKAVQERLRQGESPCLIASVTSNEVAPEQPAVADISQPDPARPPLPRAMNPGNVYPAVTVLQVDAPPDGSELIVPGCGDKCPSFVVLPNAGKVTMGSGSEARTVDFPYRLAMGKTEITVAQFRHFINDSGFEMLLTTNAYCNWERESVSERHPVRCVNEADAKAYAAWFNTKYSEKLGIAFLTVVLPYDVEWEYAARASDWSQKNNWLSGVNHGIEICDSARSLPCSAPAPVARASSKANAWGLFDTVGNIVELTRAAIGAGPHGRRGSLDYFIDGYPSARSYFPSNDLFADRDRNSGFRVLARISVLASPSTSPTR